MIFTFLFHHLQLLLPYDPYLSFPASSVASPLWSLPFFSSIFSCFSHVILTFLFQHLQLLLPCDPYLSFPASSVASPLWSLAFFSSIFSCFSPVILTFLFDSFSLALYEFCLTLNLAIWRGYAPKYQAPYMGYKSICNMHVIFIHFLSL